MPKVINTIDSSTPSGAELLSRLEQGNHGVMLNGWEGVASEIVGSEGVVEGTVAWFPSTTIIDLKES